MFTSMSKKELGTETVKTSCCMLLKNLSEEPKFMATTYINRTLLAVLVLTVRRKKPYFLGLQGTSAQGLQWLRKKPVWTRGVRQRLHNRVPKHYWS